jgi:RHS repeat-associated protein
MTASYDANNRQVGGNYDGNGNLLTVNGTSNGYSVENRLITQSAGAWPYASTIYGYDAGGKRVMKRYDPDPNSWNTGSAPVWEFYFYGIGGQRLVTVGCSSATACSVEGQNVYFKGKLLVSNGVTVVTDRLGSVRGNTQGERMSYYPYGEERTGTVDGRDKFGTYFRDAAGQDYAGQRYYGAGMGRFWTPDPSTGSSAGDPTSWNKYAYVQGDPVNFVDASGMNRLMCDVYTEFGCGGSLPNTGGGVVTNWINNGEGWTIGSVVFLPGDPVGGGDPIGGGGGSESGYSQDCLDALAADKKDTAAVHRALDAKDVLDAAVKGTGIDWTMLAAIGVRESGFLDITEVDGAGVGVGVFQLTVSSISGISASQAHDLETAAYYAATLLGKNMNTLSVKFPNFTPAQLLQATAASYNFGTRNISGNPNTIDVSSTGGNYGSNVVKLMDCLH